VRGEPPRGSEARAPKSSKQSSLTQGEDAPLFSPLSVLSCCSFHPLEAALNKIRHVAPRPDLSCKSPRASDCRELHIRVSFFSARPKNAFEAIRRFPHRRIQPPEIHLSGSEQPSKAAQPRSEAAGLAPLADGYQSHHCACGKNR